MTTTSLIQIEIALRNHVQRQDYDGLGRELIRFTQTANAMIAGLSVDDPSREELIIRVLSTIEWAHLIVRAQRAALAEELSRLPLISRYIGNKPPAVHGTLIDL